MRLVVDMNLSPAWVRILRAAGFDAVHWSEVGAPDAPDEEVMAWAAGHDAVVPTADLDFSAILAATGGRRPSVVQVRSELLAPDAIGRVVMNALRRLESEIAAGAIVTLESRRARVRVLPLPD